MGDAASACMRSPDLIDVNDLGFFASGESSIWRGSCFGDPWRYKAGGVKTVVVFDVCCVYGQDRLEIEGVAESLF